MSAGQDLRHPIARVRGLGSAKQGSQHFIAQRITAVALIPLSLWFLFVALRLVAGGYADARAFLAQPWNACLMAAFLIALFYHAMLGIQTVVEDYVHVRWQELFLLIGTKFACAIALIASFFALIRIVLGA